MRENRDRINLDEVNQLIGLTSLFEADPTPSGAPASGGRLGGTIDADVSKPIVFQTVLGGLHVDYRRAA